MSSIFDMEPLPLGPRMLQAMEILQLPIQELQERIQQELQENPVLDFEAGQSFNAKFDDFSADSAPDLIIDPNEPGECKIQQDLQDTPVPESEKSGDGLNSQLADLFAGFLSDLTIEKDDRGDYQVRVVDDWTANLSLSEHYLDLFDDKTVDSLAKRYLRRKTQEAQCLMKSIEQRRHTLEKVTRAIIQHQRAFLDRGPEYIEPLKMQQIADLVKVHVTTVSQAVDGKWVQTPHGVFPLKCFFEGGTKSKESEVSW